jgi:hypothetical protein
LIAIAAAAGFGKTSLVAAWAAQQHDRSCWLALDDGDNDPIRFLAYFVAAIQTRRPHLGAELLAALQSPQPPPVEHVLSTLINQLAITPIGCRSSSTTITSFTTRPFTRRSRFCSIICHPTSRSSCPRIDRHWRWRDCAPGANREVRAEEPAFSPEEAERFFNDAIGLQLHRVGARLGSSHRRLIAGLHWPPSRCNLLPKTGRRSFRIYGQPSLRTRLLD